jgi:hypothetical protein
MCKGKVLSAYLRARARDRVHFQCQFYMGGSANDFCPLGLLAGGDVVFPHRGYPMHYPILQVQKAGCLRASLLRWERARDARPHPQQVLKLRCERPPAGGARADERRTRHGVGGRRRAGKRNLVLLFPIPFRFALSLRRFLDFVHLEAGSGVRSRSLSMHLTRLGCLPSSTAISSGFWCAYLGRQQNEEEGAPWQVKEGSSPIALLLP